MRHALLVAVAVAATAAVAAAGYLVTRGGEHVHQLHDDRPPAPSFSVTDLDGRPLSLDAYRGQVVLLDFWATWCDPCKDEIPHLVELQRQLGPRGLQIVGISMDDDPGPVRAFVDRVGVDYPVAVGDAALGQRFGGILALPVKFVIDRDGRIAAKRVGPVDLDALSAELRARIDE